MRNPEVIIIAALAESNRVIGNQGKLPWQIAEDLQRFKCLTLHHTVIMGRKTWDTDLQKRPLRQRHNIVVSSARHSSPLVEPLPTEPFHLSFVTSIPAALQLAEDQDQVFVIGGASIYAQTLALANRLELTFVEGNFVGDRFFPDYPEWNPQFERVAQELRCGYRFETYRRRDLKEANTDRYRIGIH